MDRKEKEGREEREREGMDLQPPCQPYHRQCHRPPTTHLPLRSCSIFINIFNTSPRLLPTTLAGGRLLSLQTMIRPTRDVFTGYGIRTLPGVVVRDLRPVIDIALNPIHAMVIYPPLTNEQDLSVRPLSVPGHWTLISCSARRVNSGQEPFPTTWTEPLGTIVISNNNNHNLNHIHKWHPCGVWALDGPSPGQDLRFDSH